MKNNKTETCYGVLLTPKYKSSGCPFLATDGKGAPAIFNRKRGAVQFKNELLLHHVKGKVIRVAINYQVSI